MFMFNKFTVIELASVLAGPSVGTFFAELGARVIKVENPTTGGDMTRHWFSRSEPNSGTSAYFSSVNYKKEYLQRDLNKKEHQDEIHELIKDADIVLSNFKESTAKKFSVDFESLKKINPNVILGVITGFPNTSRPAFDVVLQAETGFLSMTGSDHEHLAKMPVAMVDVLAAHQLKEGLLIALLKRQLEPKAYSSGFADQSG
jgi:crotonobetainyl-CoA:carnitine CoA-transferase CaiB-like acyl-CoA transferase